MDMDAYAASIVAGWPPLTDEQITQLEVIFFPAGVDEVLADAA